MYGVVCVHDHVVIRRRGVRHVQPPGRSAHCVVAGARVCVCVRVRVRVRCRLMIVVWCWRRCNSQARSSGTSVVRASRATCTRREQSTPSIPTTPPLRSSDRCDVTLLLLFGSPATADDYAIVGQANCFHVTVWPGDLIYYPPGASSSK